MNLLDRYLHEVGRYLPRKTREDILAELRSVILDTLEGRAEGGANGASGADQASEDEMAALLIEFGPPQKVAASYSTQGQYLVGPALFPLFRMILGIVLAAVIGAQLLAFGVAVWIGGQPVDPLGTLTGLLNSIPASIGSLVIVFAILQWFDVRPELDSEPWNPRNLPVIEAAETVGRGERIFGIAAASVVLGILTLFPDKLGIYIFPEGEFFGNPVIGQYLGWISLSLLAAIGLDIFLLWQGRWTTGSRVARLVVNLFSITVLALLLQGHNTWLVEHGVTDFLTSFEKFAGAAGANWQVIGMQAFRLAFGVALIVTILETAGQVYKLLRSLLRGSERPGVVRV